MRIGILTFHFAFNQGAVLQCYALQKYLESCGHEAFIIDYRPRYHTVMHSAWRNPFIYTYEFWKKFKNQKLLKRLYLSSRSFARCVIWNITGVDRKNEVVFHQFCDNNLNLTNTYKTFKQLEQNPPKFDAFISGSDQVWNPDLLGQEFDKAYFLDFGDKDIKRITYAVSMGKIHNQATLEQLANLCKNIDAISLREYNRKDFDATGRDVHVCIDPTFLLDAEEYSCVESKEVEKTPYIFVYGFETNELLKQAIKTAAEKYNCRIINGSPKWLKIDGNVKSVSGYGPDRFLSFIKNAECVVTNSFHGTAFSVIYQKDFITVPHSTRGKRMEDLLDKLGLSYRLYGEEGFSINKIIDYNDVNERLKKQVEHSREYLALALSGCKGEDIPHCPEVEEGSSKSDISKRGVEAYYGYFCNSEKLKESASGGAATALAEEILRDEGVVFGVAFAKDYKTAEFRCIETNEELNYLKGSKYIPPKIKIDGRLVYDIVGEKLLQGKKVLFIGSGCQVAALIRKLDNNNVETQNLITVDLICHGPTIQLVYDEFVKSLENKYQSKLVYLNMRAKKKGWVPPYIDAEFSNGKKYSKPLYETDFGYALRICTRESCYKCNYKGENHVADITIGDYWGLKPGMKEYNKNGVSVLLSRSSKGRALIESLNNSIFFVEKTDVDRVLLNNRMYTSSLEKKTYVNEFKKVMNSRGLHYATIHSEGYSSYVKLAIRNRIKRVLRMR